MTGLADVYEGDVGRLQSRQRVQGGIALLAVGVFLSIVSIVIGSTDLVGAVDSYGGRRIAGVIGGLGVPAILGGVATVLPAHPRLRVASGIGASITVLGVTMFWHAYPAHWAGHGDQLTPYVVGVYFVGILVLVSCLFAGLVTLKRRNDPGGTVSLNITKEEKTEVVEVQPEHDPGAGGVGLLGATPDGNVETQTNRDAAGGSGTNSGRSAGVTDRSGTSTTGSRTVGDRGRRTPTSDGGAVDDDLQSPDVTNDATVIESDPSPDSDLTDRYCGNCSQFQYVRTERGMQPYCGAHDEVMDDMDACEDWTPNN